MKIVSDMFDILYGIINVTSVTELIDGKIYRFKKPINSVKQDIVIGSLTNDVGTDTQTAMVNVNIYVKDLSIGMPDGVNLKAITNAVISVLDAYEKTLGTYFKIEIVSQLIFNDVDQKQMSYSNLRLNCIIEK